MVGISLAGPKVNPKAFVFEKGMFAVSNRVLVMAVSVLMVLAALYIRFW
jgi:SSS family solute:Na+ symporter